MPVIDISDFRKGRNSSDDPLLINPGNCVATSLNVWAPNGALQKVPGFTVWNTFTATASGGFGMLFADSTVASSTYSLYAAATITAAGGSLFVGVGSSATNWSVVGKYFSGTVSVSGASLISATGDGTQWSTYSDAGYFRYNGTDYAIASIEDDTHLTLSNAVPSAIATGSSYLILHSIGTLSRPIVFDGSILVGDRTNHLFQYRGTDLDSIKIKAAPKSLFYAVFKNYAFAFNTSTAESRLYWSAIKDPTSWPVNNFIDIDKDRGKGQMIVPYGNELVCFKTNGIYKVVGEVFDPSNPTYAVYPVSVPEDFRFYASYSAVEHNGLLYFIAANGIYTYQAGTSYITRVSDAITADIPAPRAPASGGAVSNGILQGYYGISFEGCLVFMPLHKGNATKSYCLLMDRAGAWWRFESPETYPGSTQWVGEAVSYGEASPSIVLMPNGARIQKWDIANAFRNVSVAGAYLASADGGATEAIQAQWKSKEFNVEYGHFKQLVVYLAKQSTGSLTVGWSVDQAAFVTASVDMTAGRGNMIRKTFDINQKGSTIQFKFEENSANTPFKVYAAKCYYDTILENRQA